MVRVLLVEDDDLFAGALTALLEREQDVILVGRARNARDGITMTERLRPEIVVMDIAMPGMDGISALKEMKERDDCQTVLIMSASTSDEGGGEAIASGADAFLTKGKAIDELAPLIRTLAARTTG